MDQISITPNANISELNVNAGVPNSSTDDEKVNRYEQLFSKFSSELVCACLHELMDDLSTRMIA